MKAKGEGPRGSLAGKVSVACGDATNCSPALKLEPFARERGHNLLELAFAWLLARPKVASVIAGSTTPEQVEQSVRAAEWELAPADIAEIDRLTAKKRMRQSRRRLAARNG